MEKLLARVGPIERDRDGVPSVWVVRRKHEPKTERDREQLVTVAPATAISKTGPAFDTKWVEAARAAGEALEPAQTAPPEAPVTGVIS
jgi:hypothetical protein